MRTTGELSLKSTVEETHVCPITGGIVGIPKARLFDLQLQADFQAPFGRNCEPALGAVPGSHCHFA